MSLGPFIDIYEKASLEEIRAAEERSAAAAGITYDEYVRRKRQQWTDFMDESDVRSVMDS